MPRRSSKPIQSTDVDYVKPTQYTPSATGLGPEIEALKGYRRIEGHEPLQFPEIINAGPKLPTDIDFDDPLAFFQLFFTDELFQRLADCTNHHARIKEAGEGFHRPWIPRSSGDIKTFIGKCQKRQKRQFKRSILISM